MADFVSLPDRFANPGISAGTAGNVESELDIDEIDSPVVLMTVGAMMSPLISFDVAYGAGALAGGRGRDTDRFVPNGGTAFEFSESTNDLTGDVKLLSVTIYYNYGRYAGNRREGWGLLVGFFHYEDNLVMKNGFQTVSALFDASTPVSPKVPIGPLAGLNSTYDFTWDALKAGITREAFLTKQLRYEGVLSIYPLVRYRGKGFWNLRAGNDPTDFRRESPSFTHEASSGYGYEAALGLAYDLSDKINLSAGYRYLHFYSSDGTDTTFFADGSTAASNLEWVSVTRQGAYAGMLVRFRLCPGGKAFTAASTRSRHSFSGRVNRRSFLATRRRSPRSY
jgi:opacity protein-like surface antigen